jgi:hypothetical protein
MQQQPLLEHNGDWEHFAARTAVDTVTRPRPFQEVAHENVSLTTPTGDEEASTFDRGRPCVADRLRADWRIAHPFESNGWRPFRGYLQLERQRVVAHSDSPRASLAAVIDHSNATPSRHRRPIMGPSEQTSAVRRTNRPLPRPGSAAKRGSGALELRLPANRASRRPGLLPVTPHRLAEPMNKGSL